MAELILRLNALLARLFADALLFLDFSPSLDDPRMLLWLLRDGYAPTLERCLENIFDDPVLLVAAGMSLRV